MAKQKKGYLELNYENVIKNIDKKYNELVKLFGYNENIIRKFIKDNNIPKKTKKEYIIEPNYDNLKKYIVDMNMRVPDVSKAFGCSETQINRFIKKYKIDKPKELSNKLRVETCKMKYNVPFVSQLQSFRDKAKKTCEQKYGSEYFFSSDYGKKKIKEVMNVKYNIDNPGQICLSSTTKDIINDKGLLEKYIIDNNISSCVELSKHLKCSVAILCRKVKFYGLNKFLDRSQSIPERELKDYIKKYYIVIGNDRSVIDGKEIDIYIPEKKIGIEFNGNFWHSEKKVPKLYHQKKSLLAESKGIFLYHIFEYEWYEKKELILGQINNLLGINQEKIYARKCIIKEVNCIDKDIFLKNNHLQKEDASSIRLGLYYNDELVSLMTFCKPRFNKKYQWELSRFCSKMGTNVIGGASKLWNHFIKTYNPQSIISYSNIAHTRGNLYEILGMKLERISEPNYVWFKQYDIKSRYQCQKHKLLEQGYEGLSESDIMHKEKYYKIYDCGNKVWVWNKSIQLA